MVDDVDEKDHIRQVKKYYDLNTGRFLKWGKGERTFNLHGALWHPEVKSLAEAMHYSDELVAREIERCPYPVNRLLDLGCGVGGSIFYLARRLTRVRSFTGISLSPLQINSARQRIPEAQKNRIHFEEGSFLRLPTDRFKADFSYSIEAFTHCADPDIFFAVQAALLPPGGRLAIVDDCLSDEIRLTLRQERLLGSYRRNWLLPGLQGFTALKSLAEEKGFRLIKDQNLTPYLRLGRPRDRAISLLVKFLGSLMERDTYLRSLLGGDARQKCYLEGLIHYRLLVFEKHAPNE
ncbi:MAG: class I SAM-dependent methyltransferase [Desulfobacterales bacterium]